jgi:hypothetical protein
LLQGVYKMHRIFNVFLISTLLAACLFSPLNAKKRKDTAEKQIIVEDIAGTRRKNDFVFSKTPKALPVYLCELSNIHDYNIFANGGWNGSWYVGYNVCWMEKLPKIPEGEYTRAFIGAKLGRMKSQAVVGKPTWEKEAIPGEIYMSISSSPAWTLSQSHLLTGTPDIPLEADPSNALEGVGESKWFWVEIPLSAVDFNGLNYLALWSSTNYFVSTASSPILAGGWGGKKLNSWLNNEVNGRPPSDPKTSLKTGITVFEPAIAMKLIPKGSEQYISVKITDIKDGRDQTSNKTFYVSVSGNQIEKAWLEILTDKSIWKKHGSFTYNAPYMLTLKADLLPTGKIDIRCAAEDIWGNVGVSSPVRISVKNK